MIPNNKEIILELKKSKKLNHHFLIKYLYGNQLTELYKNLNTSKDKKEKRKSKQQIKYRRILTNEKMRELFLLGIVNGDIMLGDMKIRKNFSIKEYLYHCNNCEWNRRIFHCDNEICLEKSNGNKKLSVCGSDAFHRHSYPLSIYWREEKCPK